MDIPGHIEVILRALWDAGYEAHPVGGCVRDRLLGREPADWDVCTSARPEQTQAVFQNFRCTETGLKHGTLTVLSQSHPVEITTYRTEGGYSDNRHPDGVVFVTNLADDLSRRDFTINAMAFAPDGSVIDLYGGRADLAAGLVRCVGPADTRFREDALRILRALRFAAKLEFSVEEETARAVRENRALLEHISPERIFSELKGILAAPGAGRVLRAFPEVFFQILPELAPLAGFDQKNPHHIHDIWTHTTWAVEAIPPEPALRLAMLLHDGGKPACFFTDEAGVGHFYGHGQAGEELADGILRRLRCDRETRERVMRLIHYHDIQPPQSRKAVRRLITKLGPEDARRLIACWKADSADRADAVRQDNLAVIAGTEALLEEILGGETCFSPGDLEISGGDILALGVEKGPLVGRILRELFRLVTEEELPNEREILLQKAGMLAERGKKGLPFHGYMV